MITLNKKSMSDSHGAISRRRFTQWVGGALGPSTSLLGLGAWRHAHGASASGYKALVCLYMVGGNNGFNTVVPLAGPGYNTYAASRSNLALPSGSLLPLNGLASDGRGYGLHASCPEMQALFNAGRMAILCNVGALVQPTSSAQARAGAVPLPMQLFSHLDQQTTWMTSVADRPERTGWAGRMMDRYLAQGVQPRLAFNITVGGNNYWQQGSGGTPYPLGTGGAPTLNAYVNYRNNSRPLAARALISQAATDPHLMVSEVAGVLNSASAKVNLVNDAFQAAGDIQTPFPAFNGDSNLGGQLRAVARCIKAQAQIGDSRQTFFVRIGGFDTHNNELDTQQRLLSIVSKNMHSFWTAMGEIGRQNDVTLFTASDFGRRLNSNGDGSDHGWGNHHFVLGGAVKGGYHGRMPSLAIGGEDDMGGGRIVPTTSVDQYAATLASWFGVDDSELLSLFPNLGGFATRKLDFFA